MSKFEVGSASDTSNNNKGKDTTLLMNSILNIELSSENPFVYQDDPFYTDNPMSSDYFSKFAAKMEYEENVRYNLNPKEIFPVYRFCRMDSIIAIGKLLSNAEIKNSSAPPSPYREVVKTFSVGNFAIGENHEGSVFSKNMIIQSLQSGRKYFFLEQFPRQLQQDIDNLLQNGAMSQDLEGHCNLLDDLASRLVGDENSLSDIVSYKNIMQSFSGKHKDGVKVFAMDPFRMDYLDSEFQGIIRVTSLNYMFEADFSRVLHEGFKDNMFNGLKDFLDGKMMVFTGNAHLQVRKYKNNIQTKEDSFFDQHNDPGIVTRINRALMVHIFHSCFDGLIEKYGENKQNCLLFGKKCDSEMVKMLQDEIVSMIYDVSAKNWLNDWVGEAVTDFANSKQIDLSFAKIRSSFFVPVAVMDLSLSDENQDLPMIVDAYGRESEMKDFSLTVNENPCDFDEMSGENKILNYKKLRNRSIDIQSQFLQGKVNVVSPDELVSMKRNYIGKNDIEEECPEKKSKIDHKIAWDQEDGKLISAHPPQGISVASGTFDALLNSVKSVDSAKGK